MVWQPRANCWVYHPITNGLYWPKGSAKFANLEQNALKHFLTSAEGRVEGNMFFLYYFFVFPTCFFCSTLFFSQNRHVQKRFFSTVLFCIISFFPSTTKKRVFPQQRKNMFLSKPNPCRRRRENLLCFNYSFWRSGFSKKKRKRKKEGRNWEKRRSDALPVSKVPGFFSSEFGKEEKSKASGFVLRPHKTRGKKVQSKNAEYFKSTKQPTTHNFWFSVGVVFFALLCWCSTTWVA